MTQQKTRGPGSSPTINAKPLQVPGVKRANNMITVKIELGNFHDVTIRAIPPSHQEPEVPEVGRQSAEDLNNSSKDNHIL